MPPFSRPFNGPPTAGIIFASVAIAAAIAIYESPELQRFTEDLRRRIAVALHTFGDSISPQERENLFNRPEDAEGFLASRGLGPGSVPEGVSTDPDALRRQREELMYWNAIRESKKEQAQDEEKTEKSEEGFHRRRASTFDDFLQQDANAEKGTYVYHTGHEAADNQGTVRRRGIEGARGLHHAMLSNPFADEHGIESDIDFENALIEPGPDEVSDIYSATDIDAPRQPSRTMSPEQLPEQIKQEIPASDELGVDEYMTAGQAKEEDGDKDATEGTDDTSNNNDAYSSIQAWAQDAGLYSLPNSVAAPASSVGTDAHFITDGELTPTDSASVVGSGVEVEHEVISNRSFNDDVLSQSSGMNTPTSWTDVGSSVSMSDRSGRV
ncbi:hypothetical protein F4808DRAFT_312644 [Astrocystis sublimbata]|nr:hypothetical protein F4808DRAFT_312644 [Astrocystis sublimbata]